LLRSKADGHDGQPSGRDNFLASHFTSVVLNFSYIASSEARVVTAQLLFQAKPHIWISKVAMICDREMGYDLNEKTHT